MNHKLTQTRIPAALGCLFLISTLLVAATFQPVRAQSEAKAEAKEQDKPKDAKRNREIGLRLLNEMKGRLKEFYFDPKYRGIDLDARFKAAENRIKTLDYNWQVFRVLAQVLLDFNDSHTRLRVPPRTDNFEYGFSMQMIGDECYVVNVKKGSDAEANGLKVGDQILSIGKHMPTRLNLWKITYVLYQLDPINFIDLKIKSVEGEERQLTVKAKTMTAEEKKKEREKRKKEEKEKPYKCQEISAEVIACKLYTFLVEKSLIDKMMKEVGQRPKLILDLRGNGGGYVSVEEYLTGYLFDHNVKIADMVQRTKTEERIAKSKKDKSYKGELVVLVDSRSASAAEMVARVVQIERRGKVVGDVSSGAVMTSIYVPFFSPASALSSIILSYVGMSLTIGDVIMSDGSRLEHTGVIPNERVMPTGLALAKKTDPVLAHAASMLGAKLTPEKAGQFYFLTAKPEGEDDPDAGDADN
jgi:C-terminal processing protease CtpA/Prc